MIENMSLREKIGQLIVTGFKTPVLDKDIINLVKDYKIGNVILFSHNIESSQQLRNLCADIQVLITENTGYPAFITIDQEGGMVTRLPSDAANIPGAMAVSSTGEPENAYIAGAITASELKALGINFNLAPVLDINSNKDNPVINVRSYGDTKETVSLYAVKMMRGLLDNGVLSCVKHFPGHGDTDVDSHLGLPVINKSFEELKNNELVPFINAIQNGAEAVMSAHILFPAIEKENLPATMSETIITDMLKNQLGFNGLVLSDCLEMDAIKENYGTAKGALAAIKAGVNMIFISHTADYVIEAVNLIEEAVSSGELSIDIIDRSVEKVLAYKKKYAEPENNYKYNINKVGSKIHKEAVEKISRQSICLLKSENGKLPVIRQNDIFIGSYAYRSTMASSSVNMELNFAKYMAEKFKTDYIITEINPSEEDINKIIERADAYKTVIFGTYNGYMNRGQLELVNRLSMTHKVIAAALRSPYDLSMANENVDTVAVFEYTKLAFDSFSKILSGEITPTGKISVQI